MVLRLEWSCALNDLALMKQHLIQGERAQVWPGAVHFPDFLDPSAHAYWLQQLRAFRDLAAWDGLWIDMNEVSNFATSSVNQVRLAVHSRRGRVLETANLTQTGAIRCACPFNTPRFT